MNNHKYVIVKGSGGGGIGDRFWSVLVASLYCYLTNRILHVDWSDGLLADKGDNIFYSLFKTKDTLRSSEIFPTIENQTEIYPQTWRDRSSKSLDEVYKEDGHEIWDRMQIVKQYSFDLGKEDYEYPYLFMWDFNQYVSIKKQLSADITSDGRETAFRWAFNNFFEISADIKDKSGELIPLPESTIAVHVRMTEESLKQKGRVFLRQYFNEIDKINNTQEIKNIFLATDNIQLIESFGKKYNNLLFREKWLGKKGESIHLNQDCPDRLQSTIDAIVELNLLSRCNYLITQENSAYSSLARIFSVAEPKNIISLQSSYGLLSGVKRVAKAYLNN